MILLLKLPVDGTVINLRKKRDRIRNYKSNSIISSMLLTRLLKKLELELACLTCLAGDERGRE